MCPLQKALVVRETANCVYLTTTYGRFFTRQIGEYGARKPFAALARRTMAVRVDDVVVFCVSA
jgi:hypothetical protein